MSESTNHTDASPNFGSLWPFVALFGIGVVTFMYGMISGQSAHAWQTYLINFLLWSAIAQGAVLFSAVMHMTNARWSGPLSNLSEAFTAFFPISFVLFLILFLGYNHIFPWLHEDLHGKEVWLNVPFLFGRNAIGLLILYGLGLGYLYYTLQLKIDQDQPVSKFRQVIVRAQQSNALTPEEIKRRQTYWGGFYILAFALVLCLIGFDLVMSMDPHWYSTLFGAYHFVKAFYVGLGALIILAAIVRIRQGERSALKSAHFHDLGKLYFAFCLLWADFFYVQFLVIYYGNIPEETHFIIVRAMLAPWNKLAWAVLLVCFVGPFFILLNKNIKTKPIWMAVICTITIIGIWFEHLLLLGPSMSHGAPTIPLSFWDALISLGFFGLMAMAVSAFIKIFPETVGAEEPLT